MIMETVGEACALTMMIALTTGIVALVIKGIIILFSKDGPR
jgi:hypothetical protein